MVHEQEGFSSNHGSQQCSKILLEVQQKKDATLGLAQLHLMVLHGRVVAGHGPSFLRPRVSLARENV